MHHIDDNKMHREKARWELHKMLRDFLNKFRKQLPTKQQMNGYLPTISKNIEVRHMQGIDGDARMNLTFFCRLLHMDVPVLAHQQKIIYISSVWTQGVVWKNF